MLSLIIIALLNNGGSGKTDPAPEPVFLDHGPGTTAGATMVRSAYLLAPGACALSLRYDSTTYENLDDDEIRAKTLKVSGGHAHFDTLDWSVIQGVDFAFGAVQHLEIGASFGWYTAGNAKEGHIHGNGSYGLHRNGDISGWTDATVSAKYLVAQSPSDQLAVLGGVKLPVGRHNVKDNGGDPFEPALQPGSGAFDYSLGAAFSTALAKGAALNASALYTYRLEDEDFKIGDRVDFGVAVNYRVSGHSHEKMEVSIVGELAARHLFRNEEDGEKVRNSGGLAVFLVPGVQIHFPPTLTLTIAPQIPVVQALHDEQQETFFRVVVALNMAL